MKKDILVTKASGETEPFSVKKLRRSLEKAKATPGEIDALISELEPRLYKGISTKKIYSEAFRLLRKFSKPHAARYHLKRGIMELGPSGFPFEKFIGKLIEHEGYEVLVDQTVAGQCVSHEIDVIGHKKNELLLVECKYGNRAGIAVDVKTPLYIQARFEDVLAGGQLMQAGKNFSGWVATNSKFTADAIAYALCKGMKLLSWDYPAGNSLREIIDRSGLYPLTCLNTLTRQEKQFLLAKNHVLVRDIYRDEKVLTMAGLTEKRLRQLQDEARNLCNTTHGTEEITSDKFVRN